MVDFPARGQRAPQYWDQQLKQYIDEKAGEAVVTAQETLDAIEVYAASEETVTLTGPSHAVTSLARTNHWTATAPVTVSLPASGEGFQATVHIIGFEHVTWGPGTTIVGDTTETEVWVTLVHDNGVWTVLVPSAGGGGGFKVYDAAHPLFAAGSGNAGVLADFNDFFELSVLSLSDLNGKLYPFQWSDGVDGEGSTGYVWLDTVTNTLRWDGQGRAEHGYLTAGWLARDANTGLVDYPTAKVPQGGGMVPVISTMFLHFMGVGHYRNLSTAASSYPTAVKTFADLATYGSDSGITYPLGISIFVVSHGKPLWKRAPNEWVDATGTLVTA